MSWDLIIALSTVGGLALTALGWVWRVRTNDLEHIRQEIQALRHDVGDLRDQFISHLTEHGR